MAITEFPIFTKKFEELETITDAQSTDADGVMLYDDSVGVMKRMTKGELFKGKVIPIDDITGFLGIDYLQVSDRQQYHLNSFAPGGESGGGSLMWSATLPKILHDGVRYFSPTVPMPADFDNEQDVQDYKDGVGEEFPADLGIFVLTSFSVQSSEYPAVDGAIVLFDGISGNRVKNGPVPSEIGASLIESPPVEEVSYHRLNADETVTARNTVEHKTDLQLNNVDNTSDANKPISTATQTALNLKANSADVADDLALKAPLSSPALTGNPTAPTPAADDDSESIATTQYVQGELSDRVQSVATIADLRSLTPEDGQRFSVGGHTLVGIGGGDFITVVGEADDNDGTIIASATPGVYFLRVNYELITPEMFGAVGGEDDTGAFQSAIDAGASVIDGGGKTYAVKQINGRSNLTMRNIYFEKIGGTVDQINCLSFASFDEESPIENVNLEDVHINGNRADETNIVASAEDGGRSGFRLRGYVRNVTLRKCSARYCATDGLIIFANRPTALVVRDITITDCDFSYNRRHGMSGDSLKGVRFRNVVAKYNGLTLNGEAVLTNGDHAALLQGQPYGNGADIESYGPTNYAEDLLFEDCDMTKNAKQGLLLLERSTWNTGGYTAWSNVVIRGGKYDKGTEVPGNVASIEITPNTSSYIPGAQPVVSDVLIDNVDLVDGRLLTRYVGDLRYRAGVRSGSNQYQVIALCETSVLAEGVPRNEVVTDQGGVAHHIDQTVSESEFNPPSIGIVSGWGGSLTSVSATLVSACRNFSIYEIDGIFTPAASGQAARISASVSGASCHAINAGLLRRSNGNSTGVATVRGRTINVTPASATGVEDLDIIVDVIVYPSS